MPQPASDLCRSCGARLAWAVGSKGRRMPLDRDPHPDGNVTVTDGQAIVLTAEVLDRARRNGATLYRAHFATCPQADAHRRRR